MNLLKPIIFFTLIVFFYGCSSTKSTKTATKTETKEEVATAPPPNVPTLQVDPHLQNGKTVNLKTGDRFDVVFLRECIGCAEVWRITNIENDKIGQMESTYKNGPAPGKVGGSRDHIFHFTAKEKGISTLTFVYFKDTRSITFEVK